MDDRSRDGWSESRLGVADLLVSLLGAAALCQLQTGQDLAARSQDIPRYSRLDLHAHLPRA